MTYTPIMLFCSAYIHSLQVRISFWCTSLVNSFYVPPYRKDPEVDLIYNKRPAVGEITRVFRSSGLYLFCDMRL